MGDSDDQLEYAGALCVLRGGLFLANEMGLLADDRKMLRPYSHI